jgi:hypothetical protein
MSYTLEPDPDPDDEFDSEPYFQEEEEKEGDDSDLLNLDKWVFFYNIKGKYSCNIIIPNPSILGLEKTYEICEFLITELKFIIEKDYYGDNNLTFNKTIQSCIFLIEDLIHSILKM